MEKFFAIFRKYRFKKQLAEKIRAGLQIAEDCRLMSSPLCFGSEPWLISIGKHVTIAGDVSFITHDGGTYVFRHLPQYMNYERFGRITIYDNCFIGMRAIIMPGVNIGPNSVVGAGAIVTKDIPPNTVAAGAPAKVISSVEEYAERSFKNMKKYDMAEFHRDKKTELLRIFPYPW